MRETFKVRNPNPWSFPHWKQQRSVSSLTKCCVRAPPDILRLFWLAQLSPRPLVAGQGSPDVPQLRAGGEHQLRSVNLLLLLLFLLLLLLLLFLQFSLLSWQWKKCGRSCHISRENQPVVLRELTAGLGCSNCRRNFSNSILTGRIFSSPWSNILSKYGLPSYQTWSTPSELENTLTQPLVFHLLLTLPGMLF